MHCRVRHLKFVLAVLLLAAPAHAEETLIIAGAGPSTKVVELFFAEFSSQPAAGGYRFEVPARSIKHSGGIASCENNLFGRTGRPMTTEELGKTYAEIFLARVPLTFICDPGMGIDAITREQLVAVFDGSIVNWKQLGGPDLPIRLVGREKTEAALGVLETEIPELADVEFDLVLQKDHQLVEMLKTEDRQGVLGFGARPNFEDDACLEVEGLEVGVALGLVYNRENAGNPLVDAVREYSLSKEWMEILTGSGFLPVFPGS